MKFGHIEIFVQNPLEAKRFYQDVLGFELVAVQHDNLVWLKMGEAEILLRPGKNEHPTADYQHAPAAIVLYTDDVQGKANELRARGLVFKGTDGAPDCLTFTDPDGNWFQLVNPEHP